jgi:hypothetical protein
MMSTLPILFWNVCIEESNKFSHQEMNKVKQKDKPGNVICGVKWRHSITLSEFMVFIGILLHMCLLPLTVHSYVLYWSYGAIAYPFVNKMQLTRFQKIRTVVHFNDNEMVEDMNYTLHKFHPLPNIVKVTLHAFIRVGSEVNLDEASVASLSSYGRAVILYNPMKNRGKSHFRFYLLCCDTTFSCVRMKVNTKNNSDNPDPDQTMGTIYNTTRILKLNKLVMEMCQPLFVSYRTVIMDNCYTWPAWSSPRTKRCLPVVLCARIDGWCPPALFWQRRKLKMLDMVVCGVQWT